MQVAVFCLALCAACRIERVAPTQPPPKQCQAALCGGDVPVRTSLAVGATLTAAECKSLCADLWCGTEPIGGAPGCWLWVPQTVHCGSIASDCGEVFTPGCGPANCAGCCDYGTCTNAFGSCGGVSCTDCTGCTAAACAALTACGIRLEAEPRPSICAGLDGGSLEPSAWCPSACFESRAGATAQCALRLGGSCGDGGFEAQCAVDAGAPSSCVSACANARDTCELACPKSSSMECTTCSADCGLAFARCRSACGR